jgi:hypothetical protein
MFSVAARVSGQPACWLVWRQEGDGFEFAVASEPHTKVGGTLSGLMGWSANLSHNELDIGEAKSEQVWKQIVEDPVRPAPARVQAQGGVLEGGWQWL